MQTGKEMSVIILGVLFWRQLKGKQSCAKLNQTNGIYARGVEERIYVELSAGNEKD